MLGNHRAFRSLQRLVVELSLSLLFVSESKIKSYVSCNWKHFLNFSGCVGVDVVGRSGGLLLFWDDSIKCAFTFLFERPY